jgi:hypothetical protein
VTPVMMVRLHSFPSNHCTASSEFTPSDARQVSWRWATGNDSPERDPVDYSWEYSDSCTSSNEYSSADNVGTWGGTCTCPGGQVYQAGDSSGACGSLACVGGVSGSCDSILYIGAEAADVRAPLLCISLLPQKRKKGALGSEEVLDQLAERVRTKRPGTIIFVHHCLVSAASVGKI